MRSFEKTRRGPVTRGLSAIKPQFATATWKTARIMRNDPPRMVNGFKVTEIVDFLSSTRTNLEKKESEILKFHKSNVLKFHFGDSCWFAVRPSGTEPKIKIYFSVMEREEEKAAKKIEEMISEVKGLIEAIK